MNNIEAQFINIKSKKTGKDYEALQFVIHTQVGDYKSGLCFPSDLEKDLIKKSISKVNAIYGNEL